jgi:hypothetical protein
MQRCHWPNRRRHQWRDRESIALKHCAREIRRYPWAAHGPFVLVVGPTRNACRLSIGMNKRRWRNLGWNPRSAILQAAVNRDNFLDHRQRRRRR